MTRITVVLDDNNEVVGVHHDGKRLAFDVQHMRQIDAQTLKFEYQNIGYHDIFNLDTKFVWTEHKDGLRTR